MANERLRPFRDYDEHDVLNLFAFGDGAVVLGVSTVVYAGSVLLRSRMAGVTVT